MCGVPLLWPWPSHLYEPGGRRTDLVLAAALTTAEIERVDRVRTRRREPRLTVLDELDPKSVELATDDPPALLLAVAELPVVPEELSVAPAAELPPPAAGGVVAALLEPQAASTKPAVTAVTVREMDYFTKRLHALI